jgi:hypothetical protein
MVNTINHGLFIEPDLDTSQEMGVQDKPISGIHDSIHQQDAAVAVVQGAELTRSFSEKPRVNHFIPHRGYIYIYIQIHYSSCSSLIESEKKSWSTHFFWSSNFTLVKYAFRTGKLPLFSGWIS